MFAKVFGQIFDSSIAEDYTVRHMFIDLLILADSDGAVDMTHEAISRRTNVPIETVKRCMDELSQPDPASRSPIHEGKRIVPLDSHRGWGWQIVNYRHYRQIRDEEVRRSYFRDQKRKQRKKERRTSSVQDKKVDKGGHCQTVSSASSSTSSSLVPTAEQIYQAYPRKTAKPAAIAAIQKALTKKSAAHLFERTTAYAKTQVAGDQFTPHPATWFNQERYDDDPREWNRKNGSPPKDKNSGGAAMTQEQLSRLPIDTFTED